MDKPYLKIVKHLNFRRVRFVVIGGNAAVYHGVPRGTFDLDILIEPTVKNAEKLLLALHDARFGTAYLTNATRILRSPITGFNDWIPLDVMTKIPGVHFSTAWKNRVIRRLQGTRVPFLSRKDLIRAKRASGREVDIADVLALISQQRN